MLNSEHAKINMNFIFTILLITSCIVLVNRKNSGNSPTLITKNKDILNQINKFKIQDVLCILVNKKLSLVYVAKI